MRCPICEHGSSRVLRRDLSIARDGDPLSLRRRECANPQCKHRFNTFEGYERPDTTAEETLESLIAELKKLLLPHFKKPA